MTRVLIIIAVLCIGCERPSQRQLGTAGRQPDIHSMHRLVAMAFQDDPARVIFDDFGRPVELNLGDLAVRDEDLRDVGRLRSLRRLELTGALITDETGAYLVVLKELETLELSNTSVTDAIIPFLLELSNLKELGLAHNTRMTREGVNRLRTGHPRAYIYW